MDPFLDLLEKHKQPAWSLKERVTLLISVTGLEVDLARLRFVWFSVLLCSVNILW